VENRPTGSTTRRHLPGARVHRHLGHRVGDHRQPGRPARDPTELYDAANIDGAGWWGALRNVTLPLMSPVIFYTLILSIVDVLQYFLVPLVINNGTGEPDGTTFFFNLYLYKTFFTYQNMAYGATLAWMLFGVTLLVSLVVFRSSRRWVYYAAER